MRYIPAVFKEYFSFANKNYKKHRKEIYLMKRFENLDKLLAGSDTAKVYFASLPDYVQGAALRNSSRIYTEDELHRFAEKTMHEFN